MKLRLPNKLVAAIMAAASPVLFQTLTTATVGAAAVAMVGQQVMAEETAVVYKSNYSGLSTGYSVTFNKQEGSPTTEGTGASSYANTNNNPINLATQFTAENLLITFSGTATSEQYISRVGDNGGYGGRVKFANDTAGNHHLLFNGGIEVDAANIDKATNTWEFDNASFFTNSTVNANIIVRSGGVRMNGGSSTNYTMNGDISGSGDFYMCTGDANHTQTFLGSLASYTGTIYGNATGLARKQIFGNGNAATDIGGSIGKSDAVFREVVFNSTGNQSVAGDVYATTLTTQNLTSLAVGGTLQAATLNLGATELSVGGTATLNGVLTTTATAGVFSGAGSLALGDNFSVAGLEAMGYSTGVQNKGFYLGGEQFALVTEAGRSTLTVTLGSALANKGWSYSAETGTLSHDQQTSTVYTVGSGITVSRSDTDAEAQRLGLNSYTVQVDNGGKMTFVQDNPASATTYSLNNAVLSGVSSAGTLEIDYGSNATLTWDKTSNLAGSVVFKSGNLVNSGQTQVSRDLTIVLDGANAHFSADRSLRTNLEVRNGSVFSVGRTDVIDYDNTGTARTLVLDGGTLNVGDYRQTVRSYTFTLRNGGKIAGAGSMYGTAYQAALDVIDNTTINVEGRGNIIEGNVAPRQQNSAKTITIATASVGDELTMKGAFVSDGNGIVKKTGNGTLVLSGAANSVVSHTAAMNLQGGTLAIEGGQTAKLTKSLMFGNAANVSIASGNTLDLTGLSTALTNANYLDFISNKRFVGEGTVKMNGGANNSTGMELLLQGNASTAKAILSHYDITGSIHLNGQVSNNGATGKEVVTIGAADGSVAAGLEVSQDLRLGNSAHLKVSENTALTVHGALLLGHHQDAGNYPGMLTINGGDVSLGRVVVVNSDSSNAFIMNGGSLEFTTGGDIIQQSATGSDQPLASSSTAIVINGGTLKAQTASWNLNHQATIGAVTVETATGYTVGITGSGNTYQGTITNKGKLSLAGSGSVNIADIGNFEVAGERVAGDFSGEGSFEGSGYLQGTDTQYYLVKAGASSGLSVDGSFALTGGTRVGTSGNDYIFTFSGDVPQALSGTYFVNSNLSYDAKEMGEATGLNIAKGVTLTASASPASAKKLLGSGTFEYTHATANPTNITIGDVSEWSGTVSLKGLSKNGNYSLNNYGNADSWVKLNGISGYDSAWSGHVTVNLELENNGQAPAWSFTAAAAAQNYMNLDGRLKGNGTLKMAAPNNNQWVAFTGDISEWKGTLTASGSGNRNVKFSGNSTEVYAVIDRNGTNMLLNAETDVSFHNTVTVSSLNSVSVGKTLTFNKNVTFADTNPFNDGALGSYKMVIGDNVTATFGAGGDATSGKDNFGFDMIVGEGATLHMKLVQHNIKTFTGNYLFKDGSAFKREDGGYKFTGAMTFGEKASDRVLMTGVWNKKGVEFSGLVEGHGSLYLLGGSSGTDVEYYTFSGINGTFDGEVVIGKDFAASPTTRVTNLRISSVSALQNAKLNVAENGRVYLNSSAVCIAGLAGESGAQLTKDSVTSSTLSICSKDGAEDVFAGKVLEGISISKDGSGTQTFSGDMSAFNGALNVSGGMLTFSSSSTMSAAAATISGGTLKFANTGATTVSTLSMTGGTLRNEGTLVVNEVLATTAEGAEIVNAAGATTTVTLAAAENASSSVRFVNEINSQSDTGSLLVQINDDYTLTGGYHLGAERPILNYENNDAVKTTFEVAADKAVTITGTGEGTGYLFKTGQGTLTLQGSAIAAHGMYKATGGLLVLDADHATGAKQISGLFMQGGGVKLQHGAFVLGQSTDNTDGIFSNGATGGNITIASDASLTTDMHNAGWKFQLGAGNGVYVEKGGSFTWKTNGTSGATLTMEALAAGTNASAVNTGTGQLGYGIGNGTMEISNAKLAVSQASAVSLGNKLTNSSLTNSGEGTLTVTNGNNTLVDLHAESGNVAIGANQSVSGSAVADNGKSIEVNNGQTLSLKAGETVKATIAAVADSNATMTGATANATGISKTEGSSSASISKADVTITGQDYSINGVNLADTNVSVAESGSAALSNSTITVTHAEGESAHTNTIDGVEIGANVSANVAYGNTLQLLHQATSVNLQDLTIGSGAAVNAFKGAPTAEQIADAQNGAADIEQTITISGTLEAKENAKMNADLVVNSGATLNFAAGTANDGLHMGSSLTLGSGADKIDLSSGMYDYLDTLHLGDRLTLFTGVDAFYLGSEEYSREVSASDYFNLQDYVTNPDRYVLTYSGAENDGIVALAVVPEPATATLSLLALAGLAARRRRK